MSGRSLDSVRRSARTARTAGLAALFALATWSAAASDSGAPRIDSIAPDRGPIAGGTPVTLRGANLEAAVIEVGRTAVTPTYRSAAEIRLTTPPHGNGIVLVSARVGGNRAYGEFLYLPPPLASLPPGYITTVAGIGQYLGDGRLATRAAVEPVDVMVDPDGSLVVVEEATARVRRIRPDGVIEPLVGNGEYGLGGDGGDALDANLAAPRAVARDALGDLLVADLSHRVRRVDATTGVITTIAGVAAKAGFAGDGGPADAALLNAPAAIAADADGSVFVLDSQNFRIRRIAPDGTITTYAGTGEAGYAGDGGPATAARINSGIATMGDLALDAERNLYLADTGNGAVRRIDRATGIITTVLHHDPPGAIAFGPDGHLYVCSETTDDPDRPRLLRFDRAGDLVATHGRGFGSSPDGVPAAGAPFDYVNEIAVEADGDILFTEVANQRLRRIDAATGLLGTAAGIGNCVINEEGPALETSLHAQGGDVAYMPGLGLVLSDTGNFRFRAVDDDGLIRTLTLVRTPEGALTMPYGFEPLPGGAVVVAEANRVLRIDDWRTIRAVAGGGAGGCFGGDGGPAIAAALCGSTDVGIERDGSVLIADSLNNRIRRVDAASGVIDTVAGSGPPGVVEGWCLGTWCGDGGPALEGCLNTPYSVAVAPDGAVFIGDWCNGRLRRVDAAGVISTFAQPEAGFMTFDAGGNLYGCQTNSVGRHSPAGIPARVAGGAEHGFSGDGGPAWDAQVSAAFPAGVAIDPEGNLFFRDTGNQRLRAVRFGAVLTPPGAGVSVAGAAALAGTLSTPLPEAPAVAVGEGGAPWPHVRVDFTAPAGGPSCVFANGERAISVLTDGRGVAAAPCIASCVSGTFEVTAMPLGRAEALVIQVGLTGSSPAPAAAALAPPWVRPGRAELELRVRGERFSPCSTVLWDGAPRQTRFIATTEIVARIPASDLAAGGDHAVTVSTPAPGGGVSAPLAFVVVPWSVRRHLGAGRS